MSAKESYGSKFVIVGTRASGAPPPRVLPKRTPSRLDNARRWAPAAYARNHAEVNRRRFEENGAQPTRGPPTQKGPEIRPPARDLKPTPARV